MAKASSDTSLSEPIGQDFGPYTLVRRLGVGGMAETFEAIRRGPGGFTQRVCLKLVLPFFRDRDDFVQLFEREARLAARLRHSNIVGIIDFGEINGMTYMALEMVDGVDLAVLLDGQPGRRLSHDYVALLGHELAAGLEHAHDPSRDGSDKGVNASPIIHRDISPSNVLVSHHGEILLTDFGVAKAITGTSRKQSAVKGKIPYMSPEQLRAETLDGRADLFALGVVLFEALTGQRPYEGAHDPATIMLILNGDHPSLKALAPDAPPDLRDVIESLLAPDRDQRPENATTLLDLLDPLVPSPRLRRRLGKMASEARAAKLDVASKRPVSGDETTKVSSDVGERGSGISRTSGALITATSDPEGATPSSPGIGRRHRGWLAVLILAGTAIGSAIALWLPKQVESFEPQSQPVIEASKSSDPAPADEPRNDTGAAERAGQSPLGADGSDDGAPEPASAAPSKSAVPTARPAQLTVVVFPWGDVWINGKPRGPAPLQRASLKPGRYSISAGQGAPSKSETVRLRAGQRKTVHFDLTRSRSSPSP
ncbi:MAG: serine/threonine protein kinase [Myxococcales bacterium]|nr:serine/threonine protein kinase [Myxococcales bacterium]MDH3483157.1 serine/threonine protein kinase [Myxococcales bacterium]